MNHCPRNDYVLVRRVKLDTVEGLVMPDSAIEGVEHVVEAFGPKVEGLSIGDKILIVGTKGQDYGFLPRSHELLITKETNIVLIYQDDPPREGVLCSST